MEGREILLCFFLTLLVQVELLLQSRCEQSSISSKSFQYKNTYTVCRQNNSLTDRDWCDMHKVKPEIFDCERGRVKLNLPSTHPNNIVDGYTIFLEYMYNETCESAEGNFLEHTEHEITVNYSKNPNCTDKDMELYFDYVANGCYRIKIIPTVNKSSNLRPCYTHNFTLETDFVMTPIAKPNVSSGELNHRVEKIFTWKMSSKAELESVKVQLDQIKPEGNDLMTVILDSMDGPYMPPEVIDEGCSCFWDIQLPYMSVKCIFNNLDPGLYTVSVIIYDPRCMLADSICNFFVDFNVSESIMSDIPPTVNPSQKNSSLIWFIAIVLIIVAGFVMIFIYNKYKLRPVYDYIHPSHGLTATDKKIKILLLYPRDCEPFMKTMETFRNLLKSIKHFEVHDALDPAQEEEVALNTKTWGLDLLADSSTKVILVASWCSLRFYESLLDKDSIRYLDRRPSDHLFQYHLDHLFEQNLQYKRIYVVRLECNNAESLIFEHIAQNRIFTLPQFTETLINQLLELSPDMSIIFEEESNNEKLIGKLCDAIEKYSAFVDENPNYLNTFIKDNHVIDTQTLNYEC